MRPTTSGHDSTDSPSAGLEVLRLAAEGLNSQETGLRLHISENTVRTHFARVAGKLGARNACQLGARAVELGILRPSDVNNR
ncbi:MAG TPA: helix-turn-helix transcriptional regulator [Dehalococcoidia bacterium]|nr:helix-turn-helix transcriptional regulator [Dehalococcoidia bacterium]